MQEVKQPNKKPFIFYYMIALIVIILINSLSHNFPLLGLNHIRIENKDGIRYLQEMSSVDWIFIDPARRDGHGGKTVAIADCEPNVAELESLLLEKAQHVMVKLSSNT